MVILVDPNDTPVGAMEKMEAHKKALLHRAFSVFLFNPAGELLLQRRAEDKYHSGGLWTNTCCSHPIPGEETDKAASRRLMEEMGMEAELEHLFTFQYQASFENGLTENEIDHVYIGCTDRQPVINPEEVANYAFIPVNEIETDLLVRPEKYTAWFRIIFARLIRKLSELKPGILCGQV